eukprot:14577636-Alexandrium_andersonii.AAC.1
MPVPYVIQREPVRPDTTSRAPQATRRMRRAIALAKAKANRGEVAGSEAWAELKRSSVNDGALPTASL